MKRGTRKSVSGAEEVRNSVGNFSTRFSLPSFVKRVEKLNVDQRNAIEKIGFGNLLMLPNHMLSKNLLVELMERWSCEEHAFLLPPGKINITLMDVALILGLPATGDPTVIKEDEPLSKLEIELGAVLGKRKIAIATIESRLDSLGEVASDEFIRVFLLFTIGTLLFPNATGKVDSRYLILLNNLDEVSRFAWGAAVLEEMFMWLDKRKQTRITYIGGCLIFLQIWCYEHIDIARPNLLNTFLTFPRACRWENSKSNHREWFNTKFKELQDRQIIWKLELSSLEYELGIVKDLLEAQTKQTFTGAVIDLDEAIVNDVEKGNNVGLEEMEASTSSCEIELEVEHAVIDLDEDIVNEVEKGNNIGSEEMEASTSSCEIELEVEHTELPLRLQNACSTSTNSSEDELSKEYQRLMDPNMELKEENDKLRSENTLLRDQLLSRRTLEEQIANLEKEVEDLRHQRRMDVSVELKKENDKLRSEITVLQDQLSSQLIFKEQNADLKKEVEDLRTENQNLRSSKDNFVSKIENILLDVDVNPEEASVNHVEDTAK